MRHEATGFAIVCLFSAGLITSMASAMSVEPQGKLVETWGNIKAR